MSKHNLTAQRLREVLHYDQDTGVFKWKQDQSRRVRAGDTAGCRQNKGYTRIGIDGFKYLAHRLAWLYVYGELDGKIDHKNSIRNDNRIANLRLASDAENNQNKSVSKNNPTGLKGVTQRGNRFESRIRVSGKTIALGSYATAEDAYSAYVAKAKVLHGEFAKV